MPCTGQTPEMCFLLRRSRKHSLDSGQLSLAPPDFSTTSCHSSWRIHGKQTICSSQDSLTVHIEKSLMNPLKGAYLPHSPRRALTLFPLLSFRHFVFYFNSWRCGHSGLTESILHLKVPREPYLDPEVLRPYSSRDTQAATHSWTLCGPLRQTLRPRADGKGDEGQLWGSLPEWREGVITHLSENAS